MASEPRTDPPPAATRTPVDTVVHPELHIEGWASPRRAALTDTERRLLSDLFAIVEEHAEDAAV